MKAMTDQEAEYWDDYYTQNTIMPDLKKPGYVTRQYGMLVCLIPKPPVLLPLMRNPSAGHLPKLSGSWYVKNSSPFSGDCQCFAVLEKC